MTVTIQAPANGRSTTAPHLRLCLLRGFELRQDDRPADLPTNVQRLLAFLAVRGRAQHRHLVAGTLWSESSEERAAASLRTALWRARRIDSQLITTQGGYLALGPDVVIDLTDAVEEARRLAADPSCVTELGPTTDGFSVDELLPEWYDDWVLLERERLRQIKLHSLEAIAAHLTQLGMFAVAIEAAMAAVAAEPLRESAQRVLIRAHIAEGNTVEAVRQYDGFAALLRRELGIEPSDATRALLAPCR